MMGHIAAKAWKALPGSSDHVTVPVTFYHTHNSVPGLDS